MLTENEKKRRGKDRAALNQSHFLNEFRFLARLFHDQEITIDDVRWAADSSGFQYAPGPWLGSVFSGGEWEWTGKVRASTHVGSHGRIVKVWRRKKGGAV